MASVSARNRADRDPFWATALERMDPDVQEIVKQLDEIFNNSPMLADVFWTGSGYRDPSSSKEHGSGNAIDEIFVANTGMAPSAKERAAAKAFVDWVVANARTLGLQWVLFAKDDKVTWSYNTDRGSWIRLSDRGSVSANHRDHAHLLFKEGAKWNPKLTGSIIGGTTTPSAPKPGPKPTWDGRSFPGTTIFRYGLKSEATKVLQGRLIAHGYKPGKVDWYFGPKTKAAVMAFQKDQGWTGKGADGIPGPKTWARLMSPVKTKPPVVSAADIRRMATEVIKGKHGNGHAQRRRSLGVTASVYKKVSAEVNRRV